MSKCIFHRIRQGFDHEDKAALDYLLDTAGHLMVARKMTAAGFAMSEHTVRRHRKGDCTCARVAA